VSRGAAFVLLDIEGTTTPVDFVFRVLFPYARERVEAFIEAHSGDPEVARDLEGLRQEQARDEERRKGPPAWDGSTRAAAAYARWLMDRDRKTTALKSLQGKIWAEGYREGRLRGQVYDDVPRALSRWTAASRRVAIFSSGSVLAQKLLFAHSDHGDLTPFLSGYFDTTTGAKGEAESYRLIARELGEAPSGGLFVSDVPLELDAAQATGFATALAVRVPPAPAGHGHREIASFDALP
jgi:enolase-phosphatase E1